MEIIRALAIVLISAILASCTYGTTQYIRNDTSQDLTIEQWSKTANLEVQAGSSTFMKDKTFSVPAHNTCRFLYIHPGYKDHYYFISNPNNEQTTNVKLMSEDYIYVVSVLDLKQTLSIYKTDKVTKKAFKNDSLGCQEISYEQ